MRLSSAWAVSAFLSISTAWAQGPIAPSSAPGPTMKTLDQVEARIPITNIPMTISTPGSYYLAGSLSMTNATDGIRISASRVTLDLNGYTLSGTTNGMTAIDLQSTLKSNIVIRNGIIETWGDYGIDGNAGDNLNIQNVLVSRTGNAGIRLGLNGIVENCQVMAAKDGIVGYQASRVSHSQVMNTGRHGLQLGDWSVVENVQAMHCGTNGIVVGNDSLVRNCLVISNWASGISIGHRSSALDNQASYNALDGASAHITCVGNESRIERNQLNQTISYVITARGRDNVIADNVVLDNLPTYNLSSTNAIGILIHKLPVFLQWPCTARLEGSLTGPNGIYFESDNISLDMNGHSLTGTGFESGLVLNGHDHLTVKNGTLINWDTGAQGNGSDNCTFENVKFVSNANGLRLGNGAQVTRCAFYSNFNYGVNCARSALITECMALNNQITGFDVGMGSLIQRCVARSNGDTGFKVGAGSEISGCTAMDNITNGIAASTILARDNICTMNGAGILLSGEGSQVEQNMVSYNNQYGIRCTGNNNIIIRNTARANFDGNYNIAAGNATGILVNVTGGGTITSTSPWVNFSY